MDKECEEETVNVDPMKTRKRYLVVILYIKGFSKQLRRTFRQYNPSNTQITQLVQNHVAYCIIYK